MIEQDQEIFNVLLDTVSEAVVIVDDRQFIMEINGAAELVFGYGKDEIKNKHLNVLMPSNYHERHTEHVREFMNKFQKQMMVEKDREVYGLKKSGDIFPVEVSLNPFRIYNKIYTMAVVKDLSGRKESEFDFMLRGKALDSASNGILITDALKPDNPIIYFNKAFKTLTGYTEDEILNKNCRFLQGDDRDQVQLNQLREAIKNGDSCLVTLRNYKKNGKLFFNNLYITPIKNSKGRVTNFIGIQNDVTERVRAEEERNHLANIFNESLNEIYVFDSSNYRFINVNRGAKKNLGYSHEELIKMTPLDLKVAKNQIDFERNYIKPLLEKDFEQIDFETVHQRKDGTIYPVNVHLQISNLNERVVFVAIVLDITAQKNYTNNLKRMVESKTKELREALKAEKELNELKTKFLSMVSHEFKTPLSSILTSTTLLGKYKLTEQQDKRDRHIKIVADKVQFLNTILNDFLSVEKLEKGKVNYRFSTFKLSKVLNEVVYNANMLLKNGQQIRYPENIDHLSVHQDEKVLELILSNVIYNAIKYSPEDSTVKIDAKQNSKSTSIKVSDSGIGIPEKDQKNIFNRYFRAENALLIQGTGIGLNIVKNHLKNLKGSITFNSVENEGSTFIIKILNRAE